MIWLVQSAWKLRSRFTPIKFFTSFKLLVDSHQPTFPLVTPMNFQFNRSKLLGIQTSHPFREDYAYRSCSCMSPVSQYFILKYFFFFSPCRSKLSVNHLINFRIEPNHPFSCPVGFFLDIIFLHITAKKDSNIPETLFSKSISKIFVRIFKYLNIRSQPPSSKFGVRVIIENFYFSFKNSNSYQLKLNEIRFWIDSMSNPFKQYYLI